MHLIDAQYRILDVFEKNPLQSLMLGSSADNPDDIVVINEIIWSPLFTRELAESIFDGLISLKAHSEDDTSCQLVTTYHKGMPIIKYLSSRSLPFSNRINLCYGFLKDMVSYTAFQPWMQDILIDEDQIIVWEDQLLYNELLVFKTDDASYPESIPFSKVQKKISRLIGKLIGNVQDASPALIRFMDRLKNGAEDLDSLQGIYEEFQKVYLYDYYLDQDDLLQESSSGTVILMPDDTDAETELPVDEDLEPEAEISHDPAPAPSIWDSPLEEPPVIMDADEFGINPFDSSENEPSVVLPILQQLDAVDSDMEKNLELFFNRDKQQAEMPVEEEEQPEKKRKWPWLIAAVLLIALALWASSDLLFPSKDPVADFSGGLENGVWHLKNTSTFSKGETFKRSEWLVYLDGNLIARYDTQDLTFPLEDAGTYRVTLRVMDNSGRWSPLIKKTLDSTQKNDSSTSPSATDSPADPAVGGEEMDQLKVTFSADRTQMDTEFFRTGSYSLKINPGKTPEILEVKDLSLSNNGMVSLWIAGDNTAAVTMAFTGYSKNSKTFVKEFTHNPVASKEWEMRQFTVESKTPVDRITVSIKSNASVYIDDLNIDSFK